METVKNSILVEYYEKIADFHEFRLINTNSLLISHILNSTNQQIQSNKDYKQLLLTGERWNELVYAINIARYYLREAIKESYDAELCNSLYSTRMMHLYSANIWYNSIIDYILQFYYLIYYAKDINDNNYIEILRDSKKRNNSVRKQYIPNDELDAFDQMYNQLPNRDRGNDFKQRRLNLLPKDYQNKYGIGIIPPISFDEKGRPYADDNDITPLSSDKIQQNTETIESLLTTLIETDKTISAYIQNMEKKYMNMNIHN